MTNLPAATSDQLALNYDLFVAEYAGRRLDLTRTEFDLLAVLLREHHRVVSREFLFDQIWAEHAAGPRVVDTFVSRVRTKLRAIGHPGIAVLRSRGYRLIAADQE